MGETTTWTGRSATLELSPRGLPTRLEWNSRSYRVTDTPTRLEDALGMLLTHPLPVRGWRFQGTTVDGAETLVFDVLFCDGRWRVAKTYR
jgi:hypothetical protein